MAVTKKKHKCYQNVDSKKFALKKKKGAKSKFWNEGKWHNFIEPLLPKDCSERTFLEIGCSAGMYLKMAVDKGFSRVVGIEKSKNYTDQARYYKEKIRYDYKIIHRKFGSWSCKYDDIPMADVVLMSCVHYHMRPAELVEALDHLITTSLYCIVVSVRNKMREKANRVGGSEEEMMKYFQDWERVKTITIDAPNDPCPRQMYSILFKSRLKRYKIYDLLNPKHYNKKLRINDYCISFAEFAQKVIDNSTNLRKTEFYRIYIQGRKIRLSKKRKMRLGKLKLMVRNVYGSGMKKPLLVNKNGHLLDGSHRLILLNHLGYKYVIGREI